MFKLLDISGCIITLDAMGTQKEIAREIIGHGADYVLCLKANHPILWAEVIAWFEQAEATHFEGLEHRSDARVESDHHRREHRHVWAVPVAVVGDLHQIGQWAGLKTLVLVKRV
ncbi:ISAs1 family transposase [Leptolyngbya sp. CCNP1308]|uniref:ISAs1 family transposase n=1 Tax=Leptolyngbya sp. CCNP1308 TaxID=3110255 RepID=UPI002B2127AE|nr:ISAs1 family transposase [Leptolyngbya sp. CCNP1308]MEA5450830.1 ISAs1 family transposase [Leptolyngbya sp. CCNP1308]